VGVLSLKVVGFFCSIYAWWFDFLKALCYFVVLLMHMGIGLDVILLMHEGQQLISSLAIFGLC
jgi:hypothetical protein